MTTLTKVLTFTLSLCLLASPVLAQEKKPDKNHKVFFRGAYSTLTSSRANEVFTDTAGANGTFNGKKGGFSVMGGIDLGMMDPGTLLGIASIQGEVSVEYSRFSNQLVRQTTSALLGGTVNSRVNVTELNVGIAPKIRFDSLGRFKPFVTPIGLAFLVVSPPSNDSTYLDIGLNFGAGLDIMLLNWLSVGVDARYTYGFGTNHTPDSYFSTGGGIGIHF